jgi:hypothetical protein
MRLEWLSAKVRSRRVGECERARRGRLDGGGKADGEVDALAELDVLEDVEVAVGFVLIVVAHGDDVV